MDAHEDKFMTNEQAQRAVREAQYAAWGLAMVFLAIGLPASYWVWPSGITELPLASITFGALLRAIASAVIAFVTFGVAAMVSFF